MTTRPVRPPVHGPLLAYIAILAALAFALAMAVRDLPAAIGDDRTWTALLPLAGLIVAAEYLFVRFRFAGDTNAINLMEAVLAPVIVFYSPATAIATVAASQVAAAIVRRNAPTKAAFNIAQWALAAGCGALAASAFAPRDSDLQVVAAVLVGLVTVATVNQIAFTFVVTIANRERLGAVATALRPVMLRGWAASWILNTAIGLLFVFAFDGHHGAVLLFPVPLVVLHLAYRGYAGARTDRMRLTGVHRAVAALAAPLDPQDAIADFLRQVAEAFEARSALLAVRNGDGFDVHRVDRATGGCSVTFDDGSEPTLVGHIAESDGAVRISTNGSHPLRPFLAAHDVRDALAAPVLQDTTPIGALVVFDQGGIEGFEEGELAVFDALARETSGVFTRGALVAAVLEERRATSEIVETSSDGIFTLDEGGVICTWNPALEATTGFSANDAVGHPVMLVLRPTTPAGEPAPLDRWRDGVALPSDLELLAADGSRRKVSCSYGRTTDGAVGGAKLVVIARDLTRAEEFEELRQELGRLEAAEAAHRAVVAALQDAVLPAPPDVDGVELAVTHMPSDDNAPTGGDLYDWHVLPDGTVHLAVTDVLGHGVTATKHALAVISTLRLLALQGCPIEELVSRADVLLQAQDPELVATVVIARYDPATGRVSIVSGGHPPALLVSPNASARQISAPGSPIGWPEAGSDAKVDLELAPGEALVFYTDGLVEARRNILDGLDALVEHATAVASRPAAELADDLVARALAGAERRDDSLALVIRRTTPAKDFRAEVAVTPSAARDARRLLRTFLIDHRVDGTVIDDLMLVTSELVTNAVRAGATSIHVNASLGERDVVLDVSDDGAGDPAVADAGRSPRDALAESGRGLFIVRAVCDDVSILSTAEGTAIRVRRSLPARVEPNASSRPLREPRAREL